MSAVNEFCFIGYMPEKPELKMTKSGMTVTEFSLPTRSMQKDENGSYKSDWHRLIAYGKVAENINRYNGKGDLVIVKGNVREEKWKTDSGETRYKSSFVVDTFKTLKRADRGNYTQDDDTDDAGIIDGEELPF